MWCGAGRAGGTSVKAVGGLKVGVMVMWQPESAAAAAHASGDSWMPLSSSAARTRAHLSGRCTGQLWQLWQLG